MTQQYADQNLGVLVGRARRALRREFESRLANHELTVPQFHVLRSLSQGDGATISHLSSDICSDGPTLTSLLDRLEAKAWITRRRDPNDRRIVRVYLTETGRTHLDEGIRVGLEVLDLVRSVMTQGQIDQLCALLLMLCQAIESDSTGRDQTPSNHGRSSTELASETAS